MRVAGRMNAHYNFLVVLALTTSGCLTTHPSLVEPSPSVPARSAPPARGLSGSDSRLRIVTRPDLRLPEMANARYSPDGAWLIFDVQQEKVGPILTAVNLTDFEIITKPLQSYGGGVFSPKGDVLAFHSEPKSVHLWKLPGTSQRLALSRSIPVECLLFSPDQKRLAALQNQGEVKSFVTVWDLQTLQVIQTLETSESTLLEMKFSPDGKNLLTLQESPLSKNGRTRSLRLFEVSSGLSLATANQGKEWIRDFCYSKDGHRLFTVSEEGLQERALPSLKPLLRTSIPQMSEQESLFGSAQSWPSVEAGNGDTLRIQTWTPWTLIFDLQQHKVTAELKGTLQSALSPSGYTLWALDEKNRQKSLRLANASGPAETAPIEFSRPILTPGSFGDRGFLSVGSPLTGQTVAHLQVLNLTKDSQLEWIGWTSNDDYAGSPHWKNYARTVYREHGVERPENLPALLASLSDPSSLVGETTAPVAYDYSPNVRRGDAAFIKKLVDNVLQDPGAWNQMCSFPGPKPSGRLPLFGDYRRDWAPSFVSGDKFERLRDGRGAVLREIALRLPSVLTTSRPKTPENKRSFIASAESPSDVLEVYLAILLDLNGVEALSALLELEQSLDAASPYPTPAKPGKTSSRYSDHVQVLSVITAILANENVAAVQKLGPTTSYDQIHRNLIIEMARDFLKRTKPEQFRAAAGMPLETETR